MSRWEFMRQLEELLADIPPGEREEALQYYNDYFNDAGGKNEQEVIKALGTPKQVAQIVKDGISGNGENGEFTENGFSSASAADRQMLMKRAASSGGQGNGGNATAGGAFAGGQGAGGTYTESAGTYTNSNDPGPASNNANGPGNQGNNPGDGYYNSNNTGYSGKSYKKEGIPTWAVVLIVLCCLVLSPVILGIVSAAFGLIVGIFGTVLGLVLGFGAAALVLFVIAAALIVAGVGCLWGYPLTGIGLLGGGLICASLGILFMLITVFLTVKCIPGICKGIRYICRSLFSKKGGAK